MSHDNPFDDEEEFRQHIEEHGLPPDEDIQKYDMELESIIADATKRIREQYNHKALAEIALGFEFTDTLGFTSWVSIHYFRK